MAKKTVLNVTKDTATILNGIRAEASDFYKENVPELLTETLDSTAHAVQYNAAGTYDVRKVGQAIMAYTATQNEFLTALVNRIGLVMFKSMSYTNPLKMLKRGTLENGESVEEIFIGLAKSYQYNYLNDGSVETEDNPFKREVPDVKAYFHTLNYQKVFKTTTAEYELTKAFTSANGVYSMVNEIVNSLFTAYEVDEWNNTKQTINDAYAAGDIVTIEVDAPTDEAKTKKLIEKARALSSKLTMPSVDYNSAGVMQTTNRADQFVFITADLEANVDVNVLAAAFHMDKTEFLGRMIVIDSFGEGMEDVHMIICDRDFFNIWDRLLRMETIYNPAQMYWNYFLHVWQLYSYSKVVNAVALKSPAVEG